MPRDHYLGVCYHQEMPCAGGRNVLKMLLINTPVCSGSHAGLGKAGAHAALLLFTSISFFPPALPSCREPGGVGASRREVLAGVSASLGGKSSQPQARWEHPPAPSPRLLFSPHGSSAAVIWGRGWRVRAKGKPSSPQPAGGYRAELGAGSAWVFFLKKR